MVVVLAPIALLGVVPSWANEEQTRYYLGVRFGELTPGVNEAHDVAGGSVGVELGRNLSIELAIDSYEQKVLRLSELSVLGFIPQVRARYPLLNDRLVPYLLGGAGLVVTQPNDGRAPVFWDGAKTRVEGAATLGGGIEYFIDDNFALGLEGKYLLSGEVDYTGLGRQQTQDISTGLVTLGFRVLYPELHPQQAFAAASTARARFYLDLRTGGALLIDQTPFPGIKATPEQPVFGSNFSALFGVSAGVNLGAYAGVELSLENYELRLDKPGFGTIGEYAVFPITLRPRLRYPLLNGRLEASVFGGVGAEFAELNDRSVRSQSIMVEAKDTTVVGTLGVGIEYNLMSNVAVGCGATIVLSRGHTIQIEDGPEQRGDFDSLLLLVSLRVTPFSIS